MIELHGCDIGGEIFERGYQIPIALRHQPPVHERKSIIAETRANPGHKAARQHSQYRKPGGGMHQATQGPGILRAFAHRAQKAERCPEQKPKQHKSEPQMDHQPIGRNGGPIRLKP